MVLRMDSLRVDLKDNVTERLWAVLWDVELASSSVEELVDVAAAEKASI